MNLRPNLTYLIKITKSKIIIKRGNMKDKQLKLNLIKRLDINNRPLLQNEMIETKLTSLYKARENFYRDCAHITVKTDHLTVAEVVEQIKK